MRTTLELPDPLFTRLKARATSERVNLKQLLRSYVEQGLSTAPERAGRHDPRPRCRAWTDRWQLRTTSSATPPCSSCSTREHHHQHAVHYWEQQAADQVLFCTVTALGLVRLVCQPKLMGTAV